MIKRYSWAEAYYYNEGVVRVSRKDLEALEQENATLREQNENLQSQICKHIDICLHCKAKQELEVLRSEGKTCKSCDHNDHSFAEEPCYSCDRRGGSFTKWEYNGKPLKGGG